MDKQHFGLSREEIAFLRMKEFHLQRVNDVAAGNAPLQKRDGGILVLHLIPRNCVFARDLLEGETLKREGARIRPPGERGGNTRFNVDGFLNYGGYREIRTYSQLFRDGRLESVMSDVGYSVNQQPENGPYAIRCGLTERSVFEVVHDYVRFCKAVEFETPVWLFSALVECKGFRMMTDRRFRDLSEKAVDRSPAILPEVGITSFDADPQQLLKPWCDSLWQASGLERSFNYDEDGNWHEP